MAAPTLAAEGNIAAVTSGDLTVTLPAHQKHDVIVVSVIAWIPNTSGDADAMQAPSGWTIIAQMATPASPIDGRIVWFYKRAASSSEANPVFTRPANWDDGTDTCFAGTAYVVRGAETKANPWDYAVTSGPYNLANQAIPAVTVLGSERLVVHFGAVQDDSGLTISGGFGWTLGAVQTTGIGTDAYFRTFRKDNVAASTTGDVTTSGLPAQGYYAFLGVSFRPRVTVADVSKPFISYNNDSVNLYPDIARADYRESYDRESQIHVAGDGTSLTYHVGPRRFIEVTFELQSQAFLDSDWIPFWNAIRDGRTFTYHDDDSYNKPSDSLICGDNVICGELQTADATDRSLAVTIDMDSFEPIEDDVHGYWNVRLRMRVEQ